MKPLDSLPTRTAQNRSAKSGPKKVITPLKVRKNKSSLSSTNKSKSKRRSKQRGAMNMMIGSKVFKISAKVLHEIKHCQTTIKNLIPKLPFARLIQEIILQYVPEGKRIQKEALNALQEAAECYLTQYFEDSYACTLHARRCTLIPRDMALVEFLRKTA